MEQDRRTMRYASNVKTKPKIHSHPVETPDEYSAQGEILLHFGARVFHRRQSRNLQTDTDGVRLLLYRGGAQRATAAYHHILLCHVGTHVDS